MSCDCFVFVQETDEFRMWQGLVGPYYTPAVDSIGNLSWTNNGNLVNPPTVNVSGRGLTIVGIVDAAGDLPESAPNYAVYLVGTTSPYHAYIFDGTTWTDLGFIGKGDPGPAGPGVPSGGSVGQVLKKKSATDYDTAWGTEDLGITSASVGDLVRISAVSGGKPTAFEKISDPNGNIGIVQNTNTATQNITAGQYVIWKGTLYTASSAIASGATLSSSNLTAVSNGGLNAIQSALKFAVGGGESATNALQFLTFVTGENQNVTLYLPSGFRGLLFSSSAYSGEAGIINVIVASNGTPDSGRLLGSTGVTIDTSTQNAITVQTPHYAKHTLLAMASGTSIQN